MINAFRTLLLNENGSSTPGYPYPGEEYVPPTYHAKTLTPFQQTVRRILFGNYPDRAMLNYRLQEIMSIFHGSDLETYVTALDPRITYWPPGHDIYDTVQAGAQITQTTGTNQLFPQLLPGAALGEQLYRNWEITVVDSSNVQTKWNNSPLGPISVSSAYTTSGGISSVVPLNGTLYSYRFAPGVGAVWNLTFMGTPDRNFGSVIDELVHIGGDVATQLFGTQEPYLTFGNLWNLSPHPVYQAAGVILALAYRTNELVR